MTDSQSKTAGSEVEREAFEAFCTKRWGGSSRDMFDAREDGEYINGRVQFAWSAFQFAAAQAGALQPVSEEQIEAAAKIMGECWQTPWDRIHERGRDHIRKHAKAVADVFAATQPNAAPAAEVVAYSDSTPHLHIGDSAFEDWYQNYLPNSVGHKQIARDAYSAGMGDPLVVAAPAAAIDAREQEAKQ